MNSIYLCRLIIPVLKMDKKARVGDVLHIIKMDDTGGKDSAARMYTGKSGIITSIDDAGQLHGTWGGLAVIPGVDEFEILNDVL